MNNCAIFILTQNTIERKIYLKTTLYFLFKNYNKNYKYPIIILHEKGYNEDFKNEILKGIRGEYKNLIKFKQIDDNDFTIPDHIDKYKLKKSVEINPVPYWRDEKYRLMCYFWIKNIYKYTEDYEYIMRLDDDSIIEEPIAEDLFKVFKDKNLVYLSNILHVDCGICNYGMKELFESLDNNAKDKLKDMFVPAKLDENDNVFKKFKELYEIIENKEYNEKELILNMPVMYYNNFFITSTKFWKRDDVIDLIDKIDKNGGIFYYRYGDGPLQTLITILFENDKVSRCVFKYSKRLQRECFIDKDNNCISYMPQDYDHTSCITYKK